jgi:hypothetical protein
VGLALVVIGMFDIGVDDPLAFGLIALAAGAALFLTFRLNQRP